AMRVAIGVGRDAGDERLAFARQLGCTGVVVATPPMPGALRWEYDDLVRLRERVESHGLRLEALQNTPASFFDAVRLGLPEREQQLEDFQATVRNVGRVGIPVLAYNWRPDPLYRTGTAPGRGGATVTTFDLDLARDRPLTFERAYSAD